jgi:hypothetical protein
VRNAGTFEFCNARFDHFGFDARDQAGKAPLQRCEARAVARDGFGNTVRRRLHDEPEAQPPQQFRDIADHSVLNVSRDSQIERANPLLKIGETEYAVGQRERARGAPQGALVQFAHAEREKRSGEIDRAVGKLGSNDLTRQRMAFEFALEPFRGPAAGIAVRSRSK